MFFLDSSKYPIGLDISDLSLKVVQLNKIGNKIKIQALGTVKLPEGLIVNGEIKKEEEVVKYIKKLISNPEYGKITSKEVVVCLPETKTFIKLIEIERSQNNLVDVIDMEIEKHVPLLISDIYYDWQVIEERRDSQLVLIGAAPKNIINQYVKLLDKANLSIEALEIEQVALCRALLFEEFPNFKIKEKKNYAIIDMGAVRTSITIYSNKTILFTSSMPISGEKITEEIAEKLNIEKKQAEKAKIICGLDDKKAKGIINKILSGTINELNEKIIEIFEFYESHFPENGKIDQIIICGGGANIKGIEEKIEKHNSIKVVKGDFFINLNDEKIKNERDFFENYGFNKNILKNNKKIFDKEKNFTTECSSCGLVTVFGLALRGIFINKF